VPPSHQLAPTKYLSPPPNPVFCCSSHLRRCPTRIPHAPKVHQRVKGRRARCHQFQGHIREPRKRLCRLQLVHRRMAILECIRRFERPNAKCFCQARTGSRHGHERGFCRALHRRNVLVRLFQQLPDAFEAVAKHQAGRSCGGFMSSKAMSLDSMY
jgi:hypothetical protein